MAKNALHGASHTYIAWSKLYYEEKCARWKDNENKADRRYQPNTGPGTQGSHAQCIMLNVL